MRAGPDQTDRILRLLACAGAILPIWIATHPYKGIVHDGRLYTIQALNGLEGGRFSQDLYFRFGSQDSLSFFSFFYEPLIAALGPARGHLCATVLGAVAWVAALTFLLRSLLSNRREMLAAAVACIVLDADYGGLNVFHYGENFVTPRIFAESLVMVALAFCMRGRAVGCSLCLLAAAAIHPIMAATGMAVAGAWAVFQDRRVLILIGAGAFTGIVLAMVGVPPFARLLATFDPDWYAIVWKRCGFAFLSRWSAGNALHVAAVGSTLWAAYVLGNATERRLIACVAIASAGGLLASLAGGEIFHNVLLVNVQPWRMLWLATLLANAAIAIVLIRLPPSRFSREMFFWAAGLSALTTVGLQLAPVAAMTQLLAALAFGFEEKRRAPLPRAAQLLSVIPPLAGTAATAGLLYLKTEMSDVWPALALTGLLIAACLILAFGEADKLRGAFLYSAMLAAILASLALFDQRSDWQKFLETGPPTPKLQTFVAGARNIYWDDGMELFWFKLDRPSYYSCPQGSGAMFYRGTAAEYERRSRGLAVLKSHDFSDREEGFCFPRPLRGGESVASRDALALACQALPELDVIVLPYEVAGARFSSWDSPAGRDYLENSNRISHFKTYHKYSCENFR